MQNFTLRFGKYKGQEFFSTPKSYQSWLLKQDWFKAPNQSPVVDSKPLSQNQQSGMDSELAEIKADNEVYFRAIEMEDDSEGGGVYGGYGESIDWWN